MLGLFVLCHLLSYRSIFLNSPHKLESESCIEKIEKEVEKKK